MSGAFLKSLAWIVSSTKQRSNPTRGRLSHNFNLKHQSGNLPVTHASKRSATLQDRYLTRCHCEIGTILPAFNTSDIYANKLDEWRSLLTPMASSPLFLRLPKRLVPGDPWFSRTPASSIEVNEWSTLMLGSFPNTFFRSSANKFGSRKSLTVEFPLQSTGRCNL